MFVKTDPVAAIIILGSNFDIHHELGFKFIDELRSQKFKILIFSVDIKKLIDFPSEKIHRNIDIERLQMNINHENVGEFMKKLPSRIDKLFIIDGIHFQQFSPAYEAILTAVKKSNILEEDDIASLHFISPLNAHPTINLHSLSLAMLSLLDIHLTEFLQALSEETLQKREYRSVINLLMGIVERAKQNEEEANHLFHQFLEGNIPKPNTADDFVIQFREWLKNKIISQITLENMEKLSFNYLQDRKFSQHRST